MPDIAIYSAGFVLLALTWAVTDPQRGRSFITKTLFIRDKTQTTARMVLVLIPQYISAIFFPLSAWPQDMLIVRTAYLVFWFGLALCMWAKLTMKSNWGVPAQLSKRQKDLVTSGPFRYTRNPIYLGLILMIVAASIGMHSVLFPLIFFFIIHARGIASVEEQLLIRRFGEKYRIYMQTVPRFF